MPVSRTGNLLEAGGKRRKELSMFKSLAGRTAVITGASKGIGRGIARRLGAVGCSVLVVARNTVESESAAREITEAGGRASAFSADVANESETKAMAAAAVDRYGSLDILCANAGIFPAAKLDAMSASEFDTVLATNLRGTFLSVSACLPALKKAKGRIVVTSSITGPINVEIAETWQSDGQERDRCCSRIAALQAQARRIGRTPGADRCNRFGLTACAR